MTLGMLQGYVANQGDAWKYTLDHLSRYYARVGALPLEILQAEPSAEKLPGFAQPVIPTEIADVMGAYPDSIRLLGRRTAELHLALASAPEGHGFAAEPFTAPYRQSLFESMRNLTVQTLHLLHSKVADLPGALRPSAQNLANREEELLGIFRSLLDGDITTVRTSVHGDYHPGQVLYAGSDFVIIDFEGEPARSIAERRIKRSPLLDMAGMLRSFHYAAYAALLCGAGGQFPRPEELSALEPWTAFWHQYVSSAFLNGCLEVAAGAPFLPEDRGQFTGLLNAFLFEKGIYEIRYKMNNRSGWLRIPPEGMSQLLRASG